MSSRAVVYARKSMKTDRAEEQSASVEDQLLRGAEYAAKHGWTVVGKHWDDGRSGLLDRSKRRGLDAVLKQVEAGEVDVVLTLWTSRLSRDEQQRAKILDDLDVAGVEWHTVADGGRVDRSSFSGYLNYGVRTIFDVAYSKQVRENWNRAHQRRLEAGLPPSTSHRFGYRYEFDLGTDGRRKNGRYVVHEDEGEIVRELYRRYVRGDGFRQLVTWLNRSGWRVEGTGKHAGRQNEWSVRTLNRFMDSGFAAGFISRKDGLRDEHRGSHEALIDADLWTAYEHHRRGRAALGKQEGARGRWWLGGLVKCGACGGPTFIDSFERAGSLVCCSRRRANPDSCAGGTSILRTTVEAAVGLWLGPHLDMLDTLSVAESKQTSDASATAYQDALTEQKRIIDGLSDLAVQKALGEVQPAVYDAAKSKMDAQLKAAERAVADAAVALHEPATDTGALRTAADDGWTDDQRAALGQVVDKVVVTKDGLLIHPVTGDPVTRTRAELAPTCGVSDCDRKMYTRGLCKSHVMRARSIGGEDLLNALAERVGEDKPSISSVEVDAIFERAAAVSR